MSANPRFGDYILETRLAHGDAADVWIARRGSGGRVVVLKRLLAPWTEKSEVRETFLEVIKDSLPLRHPHLVPLLDFGELDGTCYVVFKHVEGDLLASLLASPGALDPVGAQQIATGVLRALAFVHRAANPFTGRRLLHGDVSPQNVIVDAAGDAHLVDLGFARVVLEAGLPGKPSKPLPRYVAPEVQGGQPISVVSDVYGAGRICEDLLRHCGDEQVGPLQSVAVRACTLDPESRFPDAEIMLKALGDIIPERDVQDPGESIPDLPTDPAAFLRRRYRILEELGRGGMGVVYKVRDRTLDEVLAVKVLPMERVEDQEVHQRFRRELTLARSVRHPNVARVDHLEEGPGFSYFTMEFVPGVGLDEIIASQRPSTLADACHIMVQIAAGLDAIHDVDVIHRDLKPGNILVTPEGRAVITDFGVARQEGVDDGLTKAGSAMGTPLYMAPEQAVGQGATARSDLYALGVLFYELIAGQPPFSGTTAVALYLTKQQASFPPPSTHNPDIPPSLDRLVMDLLQPDPAQRVSSAKVVHERLIDISE